MVLEEKQIDVGKMTKGWAKSWIEKIKKKGFFETNSRLQAATNVAPLDCVV